MKPVVILGASGNFGRIIARALLQENSPLILTGRDTAKLNALKVALESYCLQQQPVYIQCHAPEGVSVLLAQYSPALLINASGPFQGADYSVAEACIAHRVNYVDLADGRDFVNAIQRLDESAKSAGVAVISGASTVPALSSAVIEHYRHDFKVIESLRYGIATGAKTPRGLATTQAILSYIGRRIPLSSTQTKARYGWQDLYLQSYPLLGRRWMANCDIPDLGLFAERYHIEDIQFSAGMQVSILHLGMWLCSWLVRLFPWIKLHKAAGFLLKLSRIFDWIGNGDGGMHMLLRGRGMAGKALSKEWYMIALDGDGINIPTIPAIVLAKKVLQNSPLEAGAYPCCGLISLQEYLAALKSYKIRVIEK